MPTIIEGALTFTFPADWRTGKFDDWSFYRNQFQSVCGGTKAIDILAVAPNHCLWAIEIKDYRHHTRTKAIRIADEVAAKVRDSLAGVIAANANANDADEKALAGSVMGCNKIRVVLHLEQPAKRSKLFPRAIDPADVEQKMKQLLKAVDPHPKVLEIARPGGMAWTVT